MNFTNENGTLTIRVEGRVDSANAESVGAEIEAVRAGNPHETVVLDIENLAYISSAGLRVVLAVRKKEPALTIVNANPEVYDIFEMTGFTEMIPVEKAYRRLSVDGCEIIGKGAKGTVYRLNPDTIIKVYKSPDSLPDIKRERELARRAFVLGIPTAISYDVVRVGESFGSVFELLAAKSFSKLIAEAPDSVDIYAEKYADLVRKIHATTVGKDDMPDIKDLVYKWIKTDEPFLAPATVEKIRALVAATPDTLNMLHCDCHTNNIMMQDGETLLIDMDTLSHGHPIFELGNIYITYVGFAEVDPENVEQFIGFPCPLAEKLWEKFFPRYLGTTDEARLSEVGDKVRLVSYLRLMRHIIRRGGADTDAGKANLAICAKRLDELAEKVDTLDF